jgi:DNA-binding CsgD family transcriptional regulator
VLVAQIDARGFIIATEMAGAARSRDEKPAFGTQQAPENAYVGPRATNNDPLLHALRGVFRAGDWLGWSFGPPALDSLVVLSAAQQGLLARRGESQVWRRWSLLQPTEVLGAMVAIPGAQAGRVAIVELAWQDPPASTGDGGRTQAVLTAVLPLLAGRVSRAFGTEPLEESQWLTPREELVLWHLLAGEKVPQIAKTLSRSVYTVHDHVKSLHKKLNANNRGQLVARALGHLGPLSPSAEPDAHQDEAHHDEPAKPVRPAHGRA